jgi:sugar lactone lactonase YvrE
VSGAPPSFDPIADQTVLEGSSAQVLTITGISAWPSGEDPSLVTLAAVSSDPSILPDPSFVGTGATRSLVFTPAPNAFGVVTVTVSAIEHQPGVEPFRRQFAVSVLRVNDAPAFDPIEDQVILVSAETGFPSILLTGISPGPADEAGQVVTMTATSSDPTIVPNPSVTVNGTTGWLFYEPQPNVTGVVSITVTARDDGGTNNGGVDTFSRTFTIAWERVNQAPTFDAIAGATVLEDAGSQTLAITGVAPGPPSESGQSVTLTARSSDPTIVPDPTVTGAGSERSLVFAPAANANGVVTVTVTAVDDGGTAMGGIDTFTRTFTIAVAPVNDPPTFDPIAGVGVLTGAAPPTVTRILAGVSPGPADEAGQAVTFSATSSDPSVVPDPTITGTGATRTLAFTPVPDAEGAVTITVVANDDGGTANGGADRLTRTFRVVVARSPLMGGIARGTIQTIAGGGASAADGVPATEAFLQMPMATALDAAGNLFIADQQHHTVERVDAVTGIITVFAGTRDTPGFGGDGGAATSALLYGPSGVAVDAAGDVFVADNANQRIRRIAAATGIITTIAGTGVPGFSGDGGPALAARLYYPIGLRVDATGSVFFADQWNQRVGRIDAATGILTTVAGTGAGAFGGDGGPATDAQLMGPTDVALDHAGNLLIADAANHRVRRVDAVTGIIETIAGTGAAGYSGDGGLAVAAQLNNPTGVAIDLAGNVFIADVENQRLRQVDGATGIITTIAGTGVAGFSGDGSPATSARLYMPGAVTLDPPGNPFVVDGFNNRVRAVRLTP